MARKSSKRRGRKEKRISATEASRTFSKLLDEVEAGQRFLVHRRGRDVCSIAPPSARGRRVSECLTLVHTRSPVLLDDAFGDDLLVVVAEELVEERPPWDS